jgi:hypothetical protein
VRARNRRYVETDTTAGLGRSSRRQIVRLSAVSTRLPNEVSYAYVRAKETSARRIAGRALSYGSAHAERARRAA